MSGLLVAAVAATFLIGAGSASGAQRYAAPGASFSDCSQATPCDLQSAVGLAGNGDEVIVAPGTYVLGSSELSLFANDLVVHGIAGQPKPLLTSTATDAVVTYGVGDTLRSLRISHTGGGFNGLFIADGATAEQMVVTSEGLAGCAIFTGALIRDSVCTASGAGGAGLSSQSSGSTLAYARNVTAIGTGPSGSGIAVSASGAGTTVQVDARNVIAQGPSFFDVDVSTEDAAASADVTLAYSNFAATRTSGVGNSTVTAVGTPTNQSAFPIFVDAAGGDYRQADGSPTIDAGATDARTGSFDFEGQARPQGPAIDIGADEVAVPAPPDTTAPGTSIERGPQLRTRKRSAKFRFSSDDGSARFECSLDHRPFTACSSGRKYRHLRRGRHNFAVRAVDTAGNPDPSPATYTWRVKRRR
jgi:hypothetical protein